MIGIWRKITYINILSFPLPSACIFLDYKHFYTGALDWMVPQDVVLFGDSQGSSEDNSIILARCSGGLNLCHTKYSDFHWILCLLLCMFWFLFTARSCVPSTHCHLFCISDYFSLFVVDTWTACWDLIGSGK